MSHGRWQFSKVCFNYIHGYRYYVFTPAFQSNDQVYVTLEVILKLKLPTYELSVCLIFTIALNFSSQQLRLHKLSLD